MARRKPWSHFPDHYHDDERYLSLGHTAALGFHRMHITCDRWGRGVAGDHALAGVLRMSPAESRQVRTSLDKSGLVETFTSDEGLLCYQIVDFDKDAPSGSLKNRKASEYADSPDESGDVQTSPDLSRSRAHASASPETGEGRRESDIHTPRAGAHEDGADKRRRLLGSDEDACLHLEIVPVGDGINARCTACGDATFPLVDDFEPPAATEPVDLSTSSRDISLSPPAVRWLEHRVKVTRNHGNAFACVDEADDLHGPALSRLQQAPGFEECVDKMLAMPEARWGKTLRAGMAYLERMVAEWIPDKGNGDASAAQRHLCPPSLSVAEYKKRTGIDPAKAPVADDEMARTVMDALRVEA